MCCLCRSTALLEPTTLPGSGVRCVNHHACAERVQAIVAAHVGLAEACAP